nr:EOG090X0CBY [Megafenestra aurita]
MAASIVQNVLLKAAEDEAEKLKSIQVDKVVELKYDLGNLLAYDINDIDINQLRENKEAVLASLSRDNVQLLMNQIFQLPTVKVDNEIVVKLPAPSTRLPRAKPAPKAKELSKWEKYAKEKGITQRKKTKATWDEELKKWVPRYGFKKVLAEKEKNWVVELPGNAHDSVDPIALKKTKKQETVAKNEIQTSDNWQRFDKTQDIGTFKIRTNLNEKAARKFIEVITTSQVSVGELIPEISEKQILELEQKILGLLEWLKNQTVEEAIEKILNCVKKIHRKKNIICLMEDGLPEWFSRLYVDASIPPWVLEIIVHHKMPYQSQVDTTYREDKKS